MIRKTELLVSDLDELFLKIQLRCVYLHLAQQKDLWECTTHTHEYLEIGYVFKGTGRYNINGIDFKAECGDVYIIPPKVPHFEVNYPRNPFEIMFLMIDELGNSAEHINNIVFNIQGRIKPIQESKIKEIFDDIYSEIIIQNPGYLSIIDTKLKFLIILLYRQKLNEGKETANDVNRWTNTYRNADILRSLKEYILTNIENNLTIESIACHFFYNPKYLSQIFKKETGHSLSNYLKGFRMDRAKKLLRANDNTIEEIAEKLGFSSTQHFYKYFKKEIDITPVQYRVQYRRAPQDPFP